MTYKESFNNTIDWKRKVLLVTLYHGKQVHKHKDWTTTKTAEYFSVSRTFISESLSIAKHIDDVSDCTSRIMALRKLELRKDARYN